MECKVCFWEIQKMSHLSAPLFFVFPSSIFTINRCQQNTIINICNVSIFILLWQNEIFCMILQSTKLYNTSSSNFIFALYLCCFLIWNIFLINTGPETDILKAIMIHESFFSLNLSENHLHHHRPPINFKTISFSLILFTE